MYLIFSFLENSEKNKLKREKRDIFNVNKLQLYLYETVILKLLLLDMNEIIKVMFMSGSK